MDDYLNITLFEEIQGDIEMGIYDKFPKLKIELESIARQLLKAHYVSNHKLNHIHIKTLKENGYI